MSNKKLSVIAKPTHKCNLKCKYCYIEDYAENGRMSEQLLAQSIERVSSYIDTSHWIWHGGEPLLMGVDFFRVTKDIQNFYEKKGKVFSNGIQTNGTLITEELLDFVQATHDFDIGTSIDGPKEINDKTRSFPIGGAFDEIIKGINLLKKRKGSVGAICVVNAYNIKSPEQIYCFFKSNKIHVKFNPLIKSGRANKNLSELEITPKQYGEFLLNMWEIYNLDCIENGVVTIDVDPFMEVIGNVIIGRPLGCNYSKSCREDFISIGPEGDIYPCGRFDGVKDFWIGNIKTNTIEQAINSEINNRLKKRGLETITGCNQCNSGDICNSGCMHNAYCAGDVMGKDPYCKSYQMLFKRLNVVVNTEEELKGGED
ncbi:MAG: radical SAM protein [Nanoarchaeota archaeon]